MYEFLHSRKRIFCTSWAVSYCLFFIFTSESLVTSSNQSNNATSSPSTIMAEGTPSDTSMLSVEPTTADTTYAGHKLRCTAEERQRVGCLNGNCFAVDLNPRVAACECLLGWEGDRCQLIAIPPELWDASSLVGLIVGLVAFVAVVVISLLIFFIWQKRRQSLQLNGVQNHINSHNEEAELNGDQNHRNSHSEEAELNGDRNHRNSHNEEAELNGDRNHRNSHNEVFELNCDENNRNSHSEEAVFLKKATNDSRDEQP